MSFNIRERRARAEAPRVLPPPPFTRARHSPQMEEPAPKHPLSWRASRDSTLADSSNLTLYNTDDGAIPTWSVKVSWMRALADRPESSFCWHTTVHAEMTPPGSYSIEYLNLLRKPFQVRSVLIHGGEGIGRHRLYQYVRNPAQRLRSRKEIDTLRPPWSPPRSVFSSASVIAPVGAVAVTVPWCIRTRVLNCFGAWSL